MKSAPFPKHLKALPKDFSVLTMNNRLLPLPYNERENIIIMNELFFKKKKENKKIIPHEMARQCFHGFERKAPPCISKRKKI